MTETHAPPVDRNAWLREHCDVDRPGLEIGPLDKPIMRRPGSHVLYADHLDTAGLREKYADDSAVDASAIPHIDFVVGAAGLSSQVGTSRLQYVIASHVIEHVPNPIRWLAELHDMLVDGGIVSLAVPDYRRCFDALRQPSTAAEWIEAYLTDSVRPSPSRIFDALNNEVSYRGQITWVDEADPADLRLARGPLLALEIAARSLNEKSYFDVHCWTLTRESLVDLLRTVAGAGLLKLKLVDSTPTIGHEFFIKLQRDDRLDTNAVRCTYRPAGLRYAGLPADFDATRYYALNPDVEAAGVDPFDHYVDYGAREGRRFS